MAQLKRITSIISLVAILGFSSQLVAWQNYTSIFEAIAHPSRPVDDLKLDPLRKPEEVLKFLGVEPGMNVIDVFSGPGYYTEILSRTVGEKGTVAMHNHPPWQQFFKVASSARIADNRLDNVYQVIQDINNTKLKKAHYDVATIVLGLHDLYLDSERAANGEKLDADAFLSAIYLGMKPGGIVGIVEHDTQEGVAPELSAKLHRLDSKHIKSLMQKAGFVFEAESNMLRNPNDDHTKSVFEPNLRRKTDRSVLRFVKPSI